jgi:ABC-type transporter Mla subunit MlaD
LRAGIQKWSDVADYLREPQRDFGPLLDDLKAIAGGIRGGQGTLGRLVADEKLANDVVEAIDGISEAADDLHPLMMELRKVSEDVSVISARLKTESEQLPDMADRLHKTIAQIQLFVDDLRESGQTLPQTTASVQDAALRLPELITEARSAVRSIRQLAESLKQRYAPLSSEPPKAPKRVAPLEATP